MFEIVVASSVGTGEIKFVVVVMWPGWRHWLDHWA